MGAERLGRCPASVRESLPASPQRGGTIAPNFTSSDSADVRDPMEMLRAEGALVDTKPDSARELSSDDLQVLIEQ